MATTCWTCSSAPRCASSRRSSTRKLGDDGEGFWIPEGASNEVGLWGYLAACDELPNGKDERFDALFHAVGSGGTSAGLMAGAIETPLIGVAVCDDAAFHHAKIEGILRAARMRWKLPAPAPIEILDGFVGPGYALNEREDWELLREVASVEGILLDPVYTIKAMKALRKAITDGRYTREHRVLFLHTGGIYGLFPKRAEAL